VFPTRTAESIYRRFKDNISADCQLFNGVVFQNPPESGQTLADARANHLEIFGKRQNYPFKFEQCYDYLKEKPKWDLFCVAEKSADKERARGKGVKASKKAAADERRIDRIVGPIKIDETPNQPAAANMSLLPDSLMSLFREQQQSMQSIAYQLALGNASPSMKTAMKADLAVQRRREEEDNAFKRQREELELQEKQLELRERLLACEMKEQELNKKKKAKPWATAVVETPTIKATANASIFDDSSVEELA
jgi:hypothetical protein